MTPQIASPTDQDLSIAEAELTRYEDALDADCARLKALRREAADHVAQVKRQAEDPVLVAALGELELPSVNVKPQLDEARMMRLKALAMRKGSVDKVRAALKAHEAALDGVFNRVRDEQQLAKQRAVQRSAAVEVARLAQEEEESLAASMLRAIEERQPSAVEKAPAQRRAALRASLCAEITLGSDSNFFTGFTNDVSEGGVFVATVNVLPLGTQIDLAFSLPGGPRIEGKGEVRWVRELDDRNPEVFPGMGIRFTEVAATSVAAIHAFAAQREPMFFPES